MRTFAFALAFLAAVAINSSVALDWSDSGIKLTVAQEACYADAELYGIMMSGSTSYNECQSNRGNYPTGGKMGKAFCLFDKLGFYTNKDKMKVDWNKVQKAFGKYAHFVTECKDTDYDVDGGFWDDVGDWWSGEDFNYSTVDKAVGNFYNCVSAKLVKEADDQFRAKFNAACPAY